MMYIEYLTITIQMIVTDDISRVTATVKASIHVMTGLFAASIVNLTLINIYVKRAKLCKERNHPHPCWNLNQLYMMSVLFMFVAPK